MKIKSSKARNICPYVDYPRYITSQQNTNVINAGNSSDIVINNIQLNQIPDRFVIVVRKRLSDQTARDANAFFAINTVSVNFNNASGLLSSATPQDLWRTSVANGSKQSWYEFSGKAPHKFMMQTVAMFRFQLVVQYL